MNESFPLPFEDKEKVVSFSGGFLDTFDSYVDGDYVVKVSKESFSFERVSDILERCKSDYKEAKTFLSEYLPAVSFTIVDDTKSSSPGHFFRLKIVQEKIAGEKIDKYLLEDDPRIKEQFEEIIMLAIKHYLDSLTEDGLSRGGKMLDISEDNIFVSKDEEGKRNLFFVDSGYSLVYYSARNAAYFIQDIVNRFGISSEEIKTELQSLWDMARDEPEPFFRF